MSCDPSYGKTSISIPQKWVRAGYTEAVDGIILMGLDGLRAVASGISRKVAVILVSYVLLNDC